jgi:hypothetical protein
VPAARTTSREVAVPRERELDLDAIRHLVVAGWTGRDQAAVERHIRELEAIAHLFSA